MRVRHRLSWIASAAVSLVACAAAPPRATLPAAIVTAAANAVCPRGATLLLEDAPTPTTDAAPGTFTLDRDGKLTVPRGTYATSDIRFAFPHANPGAQVRLSVVDPAGTGADDASPARIVACGTLRGRVVHAPALAPGALLAVELFDVPRLAGDPAAEADELARTTAVVATAIATTVPALAPTERDEVRRTLLETVSPALRDVLLEPSNARLQIARQAIRDAIDDSIPDDDLQPWCARTGPLAPAICDELGKVKAQLETVHAILAASGVPTTDATPDIDVAANFTKHGLAAAIAALAVPTPLLDRDRDRYCSSVAKLRWLVDDAATTQRLIARARIPYVASDDLITTPYGHNADDVSDLSSTHALGFLVTGAPVGKPGSFAAHQGHVFTTDTASLLLAAIPALVRAVPPLFAADKGRPRPATQLPDDGLSLVCDEQPLQVATEPTLAPVATVEARGYVFGPIPAKDTDVVACEGAVCSGANDDKQVRSRVTLSTEPRGQFTLLGELSFGVGLGYLDANNANLDGVGFRGQSVPSFQPVLGTAGPDQAFELEQNVNPRNALTTALLLSFHLPRPNVPLLRDTALDWIIGAGPSLSIGSGSALLTQWNLHLGVRLAPNVYVTFGPSVRFVSTPTAYQLGDVVAVPLPMQGGNAVAPPYDTRESALLQFDVGLAVDLGNAASSAALAISALAGGK